MLSMNRKLHDKVSNEYPHTGPMGHSEPIGWKIKDTDKTDVEYEREPRP